MLRLPENEEETTMPDFDVGNAELQDLLEWLDPQTPPAQGRDTHALTFSLAGPRQSTKELTYTGLMFPFPGNPTAATFQRQPGLSGIAKKRLDLSNCQKSFPPLTATPSGPPAADLGFPIDYVQVEVRFRPPRAFMGFQFWQGTGLSGLLLGRVTRSTDSAPVEIKSLSAGGPVVMTMSNELGSWVVGSLLKTTVLSSQLTGVVP
jgi:hypothetical protein